MKRLITLFTCFIMMITLTACGTQEVSITPYDFYAEFKCDKSGKVAENENYSLIWDKDNASVSLVCKKSGAVYSNIPNDATGITNHPQVYSPIIIGYIDPVTLNTATLNAKMACLKQKTFTSEKIENGIKVTYYFSKVAISVPVNYILRDNGLLVTINPDEIGEYDALIYNISLLPFMCSVNNSSLREENYLFVPSGSGSLIYPKTLGKGITSVISEDVYGADAIHVDYNDAVKQNINLPVYGAKNGTNAMFTIIENGAETAQICTDVGSSNYGYSSVYSIFNIRGSQQSKAEYMSNLSSNKTLFCEGKVEEEIKVGFYPLTGDNSNYSGMAKVYRDYLVKNKGMVSLKNDTLLNAEIVGGFMKQDFVLGVPTDSLAVLTDFENINNMSSELLTFTKGEVNLNLLGYGESGIDIGKIAGGSKYSSKFGNINKLKRNNKISTYFNFDILRFSDSGNGVNSFTGVAKNAIGSGNAWCYQSMVYSSPDYNESKVYYYVKRNLIEHIADKLNIKVSKWNIDGVSFNTLTSNSYSDYDSSKYYCKANFGKQTVSVLNKFKKSNLKVASTAANEYAAINSNIIFEIPTKSSRYQVYDCDIPFYAMVFKGYIPMATNAINLAEDHDTALLEAVECGAGLNYMLIANYNLDLTLAKQNIFYSSVFDEVKSGIMADVNEYEKVFENIKNVSVKEHMIINKDLRKIEYNNGTVVYVNYSDKDTLTEIGTVKAKSFLMKVGG